MLHILAYLSVANSKFEESELDIIVRTSILNNKRMNVTGLLCYHDRKFIQFLEGEQSVIIGLYEKIKRDNRHSGFVMLLNIPIEHRMFRTWYMALRNVNDFSGIAKDIMLKLFDIDLSRQAQNHAKSVETLLNAFRDSAKAGASPNQAGWARKAAV